MLNIEVIKFEAQDVITASIAAPTCTNPSGHSMSWQNVGGVWKTVCSHCGEEVTANPGDSVVGGGGN